MPGRYGSVPAGSRPVGAGMGGQATVTSSVTSTLHAGAGQVIAVFLPVTVAAEEFRVVGRDGATLGSGRRLDVSPARDTCPVPGGLLLSPDDLPAPGGLIQTYPLAGYPAEAPATYGHLFRQERASTLQIGVAAGGAKLALTGAITMTTAVALSYTLTGGRDYRLCSVADADGRVWG